MAFPNPREPEARRRARTRTRRVVLTLLAAFAALQARGEDAPPPPLTAVDARFARLVVATAEFTAREQAAFVVPARAEAEATRRYCAQPTSTGLDAARRAHADSLLAWQRLEHIAFGPNAVDRGPAHFMFWPDPRNAHGQQMDAFVARADDTALEPAVLARKSVALSDYEASARLLHDLADRLADNGGDNYLCRYAVAAATTRAHTAQRLADAWNDAQGYAVRMRRAALGYPGIGSPSTVAQRSLYGFLGQLDRMVALKIEAPLGADLGTAAPQAVESHRQDLALANQRANLQGWRDAFTVPNGFADLLAAEGHGALRDRVLATHARALAALDAIGMPLQHAVVDAAARVRVQTYWQAMHDLRAIVRDDIAGTLDLHLGFNSLDGD